jgi:hypothetical protein
LDEPCHAFGLLTIPLASALRSIPPGFGFWYT